jgi:hypothetical protein
MISILGFIGTILSIFGYLIISNIKATKQVKVCGFYIRLFSDIAFIIYSFIVKDYNILMLNLFYCIVDVNTLLNLHKSK